MRGCGREGEGEGRKVKGGLIGMLLTISQLFPQLYKFHI